MKIKNLLVMSAVLACGLTLASCDQPQTSQGGNTSTPSNGGTTTVEKLSVGLVYSGSFEIKEDGTAQFDLNAGMVAFNEDGTIADARIDVVQVKVKANEAGDGLALNQKATELDANGAIKSKLEQGKDYAMYPASWGSQLAEVDVQIEAFCDWTVGQTVEEVKAKIDPTKGHGVAHHEELEGLVTISCQSFVEVLEVAYANRTEAVYEAEEFTTGIGIVAGLAYNYGKPFVDISVDIAGAIVENGKVVAAQTDAIVYQTTVAEGVIASKANSQYVSAENKTVSKKALGDAYAMKGTENSDGTVCTLEWYEQAELMELAAEGKTHEEIATLTKNTGDFAGVTITCDNYVKALAEAAKYADMEYVGPQHEAQ